MAWAGKEPMGYRGLWGPHSQPGPCLHFNPLTTLGEEISINSFIRGSLGPEQ